MRQQTRHDLLRALRAPHLAAVVHIARRHDAAGTARLERLLAGHGHLFRHRRRHAREVEEIDTLQDRIPVERLVRGEVDSGILAVIHAAIAAHARAHLEDVATQAVALAHHARRVDAVAPQVAQGALTDAVLGHHRYERGVVALIRERERGVRFRTAEVHVEALRLLDAQLVGRRETHHDLAENQNGAGSR